MSRSRKSRFGLFFLLVLVAAAAAGWWAWQHYTAFADAPLGGLD